MTPNTRTALFCASALAALRAGYLMHLYGHYERAVELFRDSIAARPSARCSSSPATRQRNEAVAQLGSYHR